MESLSWFLNTVRKTLLSTFTHRRLVILFFLCSYSLQIHLRRSNNYPDVSFSPSQIVCLCMRCVTSTSAVTYWGRAHVIFFFFFQCGVTETTDCPDLPAGLHTVHPPVRQTAAEKKAKKAKKNRKTQPCPVGENGKNKQTTTSGHWKTSPKAEDLFCGFRSSKMWLIVENWEFFSSFII